MACPRGTFIKPILPAAQGLKLKRLLDVSNPAHKTCYPAQCFRTVETFVKGPGIKEYSVAFQSRLGKDPGSSPIPIG